MNSFTVLPQRRGNDPLIVTGKLNKTGMIKNSFIYAIPFGVSFSGNVFGQSHLSSDRYLDAHKKYPDATCPLAQDSILHYVYFARDRELIHNHPF